MDLSALLTYGIYLLCFFFIYSILALGLNVQFGFTGIPNFTYITFVALGAYITGVTGLPRPAPGSGIHYILGLSWPFPLTLMAGGAASALLGLGLGLIGLRRLQGHYLAIVTFGFGFIGYDLIANYKGIFNGFDGIAGIQPPLNDILQLDYLTYPVFFAVLSGVVAFAMWLVANRIFNSGMGRVLRAIRQDPDVAEALGKNTFRFQLIALVVGSAMAGVGGGLLIELVSASNPAAWLPPESFVVYAALLIGGKGNNWGAVLGSFLVPVLFLEGTRFLPVPSAYVVQFSALRLMVVGVLLILVLWFRPEGILPEPKRIFRDLTESRQ
jgi:branched-chain amino acid transport system permease protein